MKSYRLGLLQALMEARAMGNWMPSNRPFSLSIERKLPAEFERY